MHCLGFRTINNFGLYVRVKGFRVQFRFEASLGLGV